MIRLCSNEALPEGLSRGFQIEDQQLFAVRKNGEVFVYRNQCPHRKVALNWQPDHFLDDSASLIQCARHGALFLIDSGECVAGPCAGQSLSKVTSQTHTDGIWVQL